MDSYLTLLAATRAPSDASSPTPPECVYKLSARQSHRHHRKRRHVILQADASALVSPRAPSSSSSSSSICSKQRHVHDTFRSVEVLGEIVRIETDASRAKTQPEDAFALLQRILTPQHLASVAATLEDRHALSLAELLDGIDAACWRTLAPETSRLEDDHPSAELPSFPLGEASSPWCRTHEARHVVPATVSELVSTTPHYPLHRVQNASEAEVVTSGGPVKLRFAQLYRGINAAIDERHATCAALKTALQQTVQRNDELPAVVHAREAEIQTLKETLMAGSARAFDCDLRDERERGSGSASPRAIKTSSASAMAAAVDDKVRTLRRRRDLRVWACDELRDTINDHLMRASELKKAISVLVAELKKEELAHKAKAQRVEAVMAATSSAHSTSAADDSLAASQSPEDRAAQAQEKKTQLLARIEQRRAHLHSRTEEVFTTRSEVEALERRQASVVERITSLKQEIAYVQRSCTPRPHWSQLLDAAVVTTAIDRAGKNAKVRMEQSRNRLLGGKATASESDDEQDERDEHQLKHVLTSHWSTIDKVRAMSTELARMRIKHHAGDTLVLEQAKLDHLQKEIVRTLQQLNAIKDPKAAE